MNAQQTRKEANRQICMLKRVCSPEERERLRKYIKPIPESVQEEVAHRCQPVHISKVLPEVMAQIERRIELGRCHSGKTKE